MEQNNNYQVVNILIENLSPIEGYIHERADDLYEKILFSGIWTTPVVIDDQYGLIMDGHHRFEVSKRLNLKYIPSIVINYENVKVWSLRDDEIVTVDRIIDNFKNSIIYPNKTAKHSFPFELESNLEINIEELK